VVGEEPLKVTVIGLLSQKLRFAGCTSVGEGLMTTVKVTAVPEQEPATGVAVMEAVCGVFPVLVPVKFRLPLPDVLKPILVLLLAQLKVAPVLPLHATFTFWPAQTVTLTGWSMEGGGATVILKF